MRFDFCGKDNALPACLAEQAVKANADYDTLGAEASMFAQREAAQGRSAIPGPVPSEVFSQPYTHTPAATQFPSSQFLCDTVTAGSGGWATGGETFAEIYGLERRYWNWCTC